MKTQEKTIKVYYGLKWVEFKPITKEKSNNKPLAVYPMMYRRFLYVHPKQQFSIRKRK